MRSELFRNLLGDQNRIHVCNFVKDIELEEKTFEFKYYNYATKFALVRTTVKSLEIRNFYGIPG